MRPSEKSFPLWAILGSIVLSLYVPSYFLWASVLEGSNQVHVTAIVPEVSTSAGSSTGSGTAGGLSIGVNSTNGTPSNDEEGVSPQVATNITSETTEQGFSPEEELEEEDANVVFEEVIKSTTVYFGGYTFPNAQVAFTLNGESSFIMQADQNGYFEGSYSGVPLGENAFSFVSEDYNGNESNLISYVYTVQNESPVYIPYILLPPVIYVTNSGEVEGMSIPGSQVQVYGVDKDDQSLVVVDTIEVDSGGNFLIDFDLGQALPYQEFYISCDLDSIDCGYSGIIRVQTVGETSRFVEGILADFTQDIQVNFIDFAFMRAAFLNNSNYLFYDLNRDGEVDLLDFSLLNYQWTL